MSSNDADFNFKIMVQHIQHLEQQYTSILNNSISVRQTVEGIEKQDDAFYTFVKNALKQQNDKIFEIIKKIDTICSVLYSKEYLLNVGFERAYYKMFPTGPSANFPNFQEDFLRLLNGLDQLSKETICLSIQRLRIIQNCQELFLPLYSEEEKRSFRQISERFMSNILQIGDKCFSLREYLLPINHFESCVFWDKCGVPYLENLCRLENKDIIDAGAFIGDSALIFSPLTNRNVYAFEPVPQNYCYMQDTIKLNGLTNVVPVQAALGEKSGTISISVNDSSSTQFENDACQYAEKVEAKVVTLDEFVREHHLCVGLIKADVEGAEQSLLKGAMQTIKDQKPTLLISIYHNADDFFHIKPMLEHLDLGYRFKIRHPVCGSVMTETILIAEAD